MFYLLYFSSLGFGLFVGSRIALKLLNVKDSVNKRSLILAGLVLLAEAIGTFITSIGDLNGSGASIFSLLFFMIIIRKFLVLSTWQTIIVPIGISTVAIIFVTFMLKISLSIFGPINVW